MTLKTNFANFPKDAPYSRDELQFARNYIEEILKWKKKVEKELLERKKNWRKTPNRWVAVDNPHVSIKELLGK